MLKKNLNHLLFFREVNPAFNNNEIYKLICQVKMGNDGFAALGTEYLAIYVDYFLYLRSIIANMTFVNALNLWTLLADDNMKGEFKAELFQMLLEKPGAKEACLYTSTGFSKNNWSILTGAAQFKKVSNDTSIFEIIKRKLQEYNQWEYISSLVDETGCTALDYLREPPGEYADYTGNPDLLYLRFDLEKLIIEEPPLTLKVIIEKDDTKALEEFIKNLGDNARDVLLNEQVYEKTQEGKQLIGTLLHLIAKSGAIMCFDLLKHFLGDDFEQLFTSINEQTPLFLALKNDNVITVEKLATSFPSMFEKEFTSNKSTLDELVRGNNLLILNYVLSRLPKNNSFIDSYLQKKVSLSRSPGKAAYESVAAFFVISKYYPIRNDSAFIKNYLPRNEEPSFILKQAITNYTISNVDNRLYVNSHAVERVTPAPYLNM